MADFFDWGEPVEELPSALANPQLLAILRACEEHSDFRFVELRRVSTVPPHVGVVVDACDGTIAPQNSVGILPRERLCLSFRPGASTPAEVRALRSDFPDVLHLNGVAEHEPASLCLYESWSFEERRWTAQRYLARILWWLRRSSDGTLHAQDQGLEQLFYDTGHVVVLPAEFSGQTAEELGPIHLAKIEREGQRTYLIASRAKPGKYESLIQPLVVDLPSISNQPVQRAARTLGELDDQLRNLGSALEPHLSQAIKRQSRVLNGEAALSGALLLLLRVPRMRDDEIERVDVRGFLLIDGFEEMGIKLGALFRPQPGKPAFAVDDIVIGAPKPGQSEAWRSFDIAMVDPRPMPSRAQARAMSGIDEKGADFPGVLAGVGSLGSAMADTWVRTGWGRWTFIDPDEVSPHNLVRHRARSAEVGFPKARVVQAQSAYALGQGREQASAICAQANDLSNSDVQNALKAAELLVDASTTIEVPRDWSELDLPRSASAFFTFSGLSAVLLVEDQNRQVRLSSLEAQYYRAIITQEWGESHLGTPGSVRVGTGCRDHSVVLSYELVQLHAAQLSRQLRKAVAQSPGSIKVWILDDATGGLAATPVPVHSARSRQLGEWSVRWDDGLVAKMRAMREAKLPSETGGILVGVIDQKLRTITVVDACDAPADSQEEAHSFVRGTEGGQAYVARCERLTAGMVEYVGEWHSHPKGHSVRPSGTDLVLLETLTLRLHEDGIPALMVIVSEEDFGVSLGATVS
jgi:integrative and conjugative element protein (TIGR02256 family)